MDAKLLLARADAHSLRPFESLRASHHPSLRDGRQRPSLRSQAPHLLDGFLLALMRNEIVAPSAERNAADPTAPSARFAQTDGNAHMLHI